jgi:hypothetical protein
MPAPTAPRTETDKEETMIVRRAAPLLLALLLAACGTSEPTGSEAPPSETPSSSPATTTPSPTPSPSSGLTTTIDPDLTRWGLSAIAPADGPVTWRSYTSEERYRGAESIAATAADPLGAIIGEVAAIGRYPVELAVFEAGTLAIAIVIDGSDAVHPICAPLPTGAAVGVLGSDGKRTTAPATAFESTMFGLPAVGIAYTIADPSETSVHHIYTCATYNGRELLLRQRISERGAREAGIYDGDWSPLEAVWPTMAAGSPALVPTGE